MDLDRFEETLYRLFGENGSTYRLYRTSPNEDLAPVVWGAVEDGYDLVAAAGGDGTVSQVADGLQGVEIPLGILPSGTGNVLAHELGIPSKPEQAIRLLLEEHTIRKVDGMKIGRQIYLLDVGVGLSSLTMDSTPQASKRRFGTLAYLWTGVKRLAGWQPARFQLEIDGHSLFTAAIEVSITNTRMAGGKYFHWGEDIKVDDGRVCVCAVRGKTLVDYLQTILDFLVGQAERSRHILCFDAHQQVHIEAQEPLPVQADGEMIGETPIDITILPQVIQVVVPCQAAGAG